MSVHAWAAAEFLATGSIPPVFAPIQTQAALYFSLFAAFAFSGVAVTGWGMLTSTAAPRWVGLTMMAVGIVGAPIVTLIGPWMLYVPVVMLGLALLGAFTSQMS